MLASTLCHTSMKGHGLPLNPIGEWLVYGFTCHEEKARRFQDLFVLPACAGVIAILCAIERALI